MARRRRSESAEESDEDGSDGDGRPMVYVVCEGFRVVHTDRREYKIGRSKDLIARVDVIQAHQPRKTCVAVAIETDDAVRDERLLHKHFRDHHLHHEWFNLTSEEVDQIGSLSWRTMTLRPVNPKHDSTAPVLVTKPVDRDLVLDGSGTAAITLEDVLKLDVNVNTYGPGSFQNRLAGVWSAARRLIGLPDLPKIKYVNPGKNRRGKPGSLEIVY